MLIKRKTGKYKIIKRLDNNKIWDELELSLSEDDNNYICLSIVASLIKRRLELNYTQRDLEVLSGVKQSAIARMESFKSSPKLDTIFILAKALKLKVKISFIDDDKQNDKES